MNAATDTSPWNVPSGDPPPLEALPGSPAAGLLVSWVADLIYQRSVTASRSLSRAVGPSGLGTACDKELAYSAAGVPRLNFSSDPWAAIVGTSVHDWMANLMRDQDAGSGRYLVESKTAYRGIKGTADLYDRRERVVIDWKTTRKSKVRRIQRTAPPPNYITQINTYAAGLAAGGESPERVALVFLPVDGKLTDIHAWVAPFDRAIADRAIDRLEALRGTPLAQVPASPSRLCDWCDFHQPGVQDGPGCSGNQGKA